MSLVRLTLSLKRAPARLRRALLVGWLLYLPFAAGAHAQTSGQRQRQFARAIEQQVTVSWRDQSLAAALSQLGRLHDIPIWLDRRIDPRQLVDLQLKNQSIRAIVETVAQQRGLDAAICAGVVYVGPAAAARELATLIELARDSVKDAPAAVRRRWLTSVRVSWPRLTEPRSLIEQAAADAGGIVVNLEHVSHDLWDARSDFWIAPIDLAALSLAGFDLTCRVAANGRELHVVEIERPVQLVRSYVLDAGQRPLVEPLLRVLPADGVRMAGDKLTLSGRLEQHEQLESILRGKARARAARAAPPTAPGQQAYTLQIENQPVGPVLEQLAGQLGITVAWDLGDDAPESLRRQRISCEVRQASLDELLRAVLDPAGLRGERQNAKLIIRKK